jgi:hypothetical protein
VLIDSDSHPTLLLKEYSEGLPQKIKWWKRGINVKLDTVTMLRIRGALPQLSYVLMA